MNDIEKIIGEKFRDFTLEFMERICKQILQNRNEGHWYWLRDDQVKDITKDTLEKIKGDEE